MLFYCKGFNFSFDYSTHTFILDDAKYEGITCNTKTKKEMQSFIKNHYFNSNGNFKYRAYK
jgi:hypothetical protein